jgi:hypothetical protein
MISLLVSAQLISPLAPAALADPAGPTVSLSQTSLNFGNVGVGMTSAPQDIVLTNTGTSDLVISSITFAPPYGASDFGETDTCTTGPLAIGAHCTITVTFEPTFPGMRTGQLAITDNAAGSPQTIFLLGNAQYAAINFSSNGLAFGDQLVGVPTTENLIVTNSGSGPLAITNVSISGPDARDFKASDTCTTAHVAPHASCTIVVTFGPSVDRLRSANLVLTDNAADSPQTLPLTGNGVYPVLTLVPNWLDFGIARVKTPSATQYLFLFNTGTIPATVANVSVGGLDSSDFGQTNTCTLASIVPGTYCTISVRFVPRLSGDRNATLIITDNALSRLQSATLRGISVESGRTGGTAVSVSGDNTISVDLGTATKVVAAGNGKQTAAGGAATILKRTKPILVRLRGLPRHLARVTMTAELWALRTAPRPRGASARRSTVVRRGARPHSLLYHSTLNARVDANGQVQMRIRPSGLPPRAVHAVLVLAVRTAHSVVLQRALLVTFP